MDLARVSFGGLDRFLSLKAEHQKGNLLTFWYLHALKLMLSMLPQPTVVEEPRQRGRVLRKPNTSYHRHTKDHYHQEILSVLDWFLWINHALGSQQNLLSR